MNENKKYILAEAEKIRHKKLFLIVSFVVADNNNGLVEIYRNKKLETRSDIFELQDFIEENFEYKGVMITNILYFKNK